MLETTLTEALPAGPELDAIVQEKVLGLPLRYSAVSRTGGAQSIVGTPKTLAECLLQCVQCEQWDAKRDYHSQWFPEPYPERDYSTTWEGAGLVIDHLSAAGYELRLHDCWGAPAADRWWASFHDREEGGRAATAPEAICRAALAAVAQLRPQ